jgi:tellurite methyltransferase
MADWDARYREGGYDKGNEPHALLKRFEPLMPAGVVIDIAAGSGRDDIFLAGKGHFVCGLDSSQEALKIARARSIAEGLEVALVAGDALSLPFKRNSAAAVMVFHFLERKIMGEIVDLLGKGGILIYETFLKRQNVIDRWRNPDYLLDDGELLSYFSALDLLFYQETVTTSPEGKRRAVAQYAGRKQ